MPAVCRGLIHACTRACVHVFWNTVGACGCKVTWWCKRVDPLLRLPQASVTISQRAPVGVTWQTWNVCCSDETFCQCVNKVAEGESVKLNPSPSDVILYQLNCHFQVAKYLFALSSVACVCVCRTHTHTHTNFESRCEKYTIVRR